MIFRKKKRKRNNIKKKKPVAGRILWFQFESTFLYIPTKHKANFNRKIYQIFETFFFNKQTLEHSTHKHKYYLLP